LADQFEKAVRVAGGNIVRREYTNDKAVNFKAIITNLKKSKPQAIFYGGAEGQSGPLLKQMRELGVKAVFISGEMSKTDRFIQLAGAQAAEGAIVSLAGLPLKDMPGGMEYQKEYQKRFGTAVELYSPYAYDGAMAMLTAIRKADSSDPKKYLPVLANINMLGVTTKHIRYSSNGDLKNATVTVYKVENGHWIPLESITGK
jgi:branched-chain amino acid transport system substrate-binding protein